MLLSEKYVAPLQSFTGRKPRWLMNNEPLRSNIQDKDQLSLLALTRSWGHCIFFRRIQMWKRKSDVRSAGTRDQCTFSNSAASSMEHTYHPWLSMEAFDAVRKE
ncbi:hypothetical protein FOQG_03006 [Fusarium oxysporum f. sp. raphani 54005]|uniref:Uncharacterized protein n=1 Tax=Fusarium oxysporum f. sp. raphani 54005 TaxID=1089458 RepID=X0CNG3_FUSOX|nr:hypothetical protein FOQG_03006 [Fusarium oxysporum f. sp. raphani 54005]EXK95672.1 hypothetical protein FOQG_03006 [Fusarium oxysporum f. sp. raphani 54005]